MSNVQKDSYNCCGCTACISVCPKNAIKLKEDKKGFYYPDINLDLCIHCGLCKRVCDFIVFDKLKSKHKVTSYAIRHKDIQEVVTSRSGAFFSAVAKYVINRGGVCYGTVLTSNLEIIHKRVETLKDCFQFKGSKYVQSKIDEGLFKQCKQDLERGRYVLFSGTGCQVHGLLSYLNIENVNINKLITTDFICHGVPSPGVWKKYISELEKQKGKKIIYCNFRDKEKFGWTDHVETYLFEDKTEYSESNWASVFYQHCMFRDSCYNCPYTTVARCSDFTMGDYWGFEKVVNGYNDNKGLSLVIAQNQKAEVILENLSDVLEIYPTDLEKSLQPQLKKPVYKGSEYKRFWKKWFVDPEITINYFFFPGSTRKFFLLLKKKAKQIFKYVIKTFMI